MIRDTLDEIRSLDEQSNGTDDADRLTLDGDGDDHDDEAEILGNADETE